MCITVKDRFLNMTTNDMLSFTIFENRNVKVLIIKGFFKVSFVIFLQNILVNLYKRLYYVNGNINRSFIWR